MVPVHGAVERQPIGSALQNRFGSTAVRRGDVLDRIKPDRGQMRGIVWVGKPRNVGSPARGGHGDPEVVEDSAAADKRIAPGLICGRRNPTAICEQVDGVVLDQPSPRLTVMYRGCPAGQQDGILENLDVHSHDATEA